MAARCSRSARDERQVARWCADSKYARRITADTADARSPARPPATTAMKTKADPTGRRVLGMLNNCAGGITPWGTWLTCEENFNGYFWGKVADDHPEAKNFKRYGVPGNWYAWGKFARPLRRRQGAERGQPLRLDRRDRSVRSDLDAEEAHRARPLQARGRRRHRQPRRPLRRLSAATTSASTTSTSSSPHGTVDRANRAANRDLLDDGTLYVARYNADGTGDWLPLVHGQGPLTAANGFTSQADVLIETRARRRPARRHQDGPARGHRGQPEDQQRLCDADQQHAPQGRAGRRRQSARQQPVRPHHRDDARRRRPRRRPSSLGNPGEVRRSRRLPRSARRFHPATTKDGWFGMPDNCAIDAEGRLWIATDGNSDRDTGRTDGLWAIETEGDGARHLEAVLPRARPAPNCAAPSSRPTTRRCSSPSSIPATTAEVEGVRPAVDLRGPVDPLAGLQPKLPPRPSVVAITKRGGGKIGDADAGGRRAV